MKRLSSMLGGLGMACVLLSCLAQADVNPKFAKLRDAAEPISGLGTFLDKYVGECDGAGPECKASAQAFRREANQRHYYMIITEDAATMIAPGAYNPSADEMTLNVTPFFPAGGYALTHGAPHRTDAAGNPVMPLLYVKAKVPDGMNASSMARLIGMRALRMQVIFTPQDVWSLSKKEKGTKSYGIKARIDAMLITVGRTGEELALWTAR